MKLTVILEDYPDFINFEKIISLKPSRIVLVNCYESNPIYSRLHFSNQRLTKINQNYQKLKSIEVLESVMYQLESRLRGIQINLISIPGSFEKLMEGMSKESRVLVC